MYSLARINDSLTALEGACYFTCIVLKSGYYQIEIEPPDRSKTVFITCDGLYEWKIMPFGLTNAPATAGLKLNTCLIYLDILIFSKDFDEHLVQLEKILKRLSEANLTLNLSKTKFCFNQITYLDHVVGEHGQQPDKLKSVREFPTPQNVDDIRVF